VVLGPGPGPPAGPGVARRLHCIQVAADPVQPAPVISPQVFSHDRQVKILGSSGCFPYNQSATTLLPPSIECTKGTRTCHAGSANVPEAIIVQ
jgi:hypothetical protein